jgi:cytochrome c-type biogenesis protein CcsB
MIAATENLLQQDSVHIIWELRAVWVAILIYFLSAIYYLIWLFLPGARIGRLASRLFLTGAILQTATIVARWMAVGRLPSESLYESLQWFAWSAAVTYIFVERRFKGVYAAGFPVAAVACAACLYAILGRSPGVSPLFPALQSDWFIWHVVITSMAYAVFVVAFAVECGYVILARLLPPQMFSRYGMDTDTMARFHRAAHLLALFGFPLLTFGIISGAAWSEQAWGRYWSWDPKETWLLITWTVYALYLHAMTLARWRGGRATALSILGFICMFMAFLGVSWIAKLLGIPSIHAYSV